MSLTDYDKRQNYLAAGILLNISVILILIFTPTGFSLNEPESLMMFFLGIGIMILGEFLLLKNNGGNSEGLALSKFCWGIASWIICSTITTFSLMVIPLVLYASVMGLAIWWLTLALGVKILFSGYYAPIRKWTAVVPIIAIGVVITRFGTVGAALRLLFFMTPMIMLIYLCVRYRRQNRNRITIVIASFTIALNLILLFFIIAKPEGDAGLSNVINGVYFCGIILALLSFVFLFNHRIGERNENYSRNGKYTAIFWCSLVALGAGIWAVENNPIIIGVSIVSVLTIMMIYEMLEFYYGHNDNFSRYRAAVSRYQQECDQNRKVTNFLHDEILQDIYAIKLMAGTIKEANSTGEDIEELTNKLQLRIRDELEFHDISLKKSLSYKENIEQMIDSVKKRYGALPIETYIDCGENLMLTPPYDGIAYSIIRELVSNVFKHSKATYCNISIKMKGKYIQLEVADDGATIKNKEGELLNLGFGLSSLSDQVFALGGDFTLKKNINGGLTVVVEMLGEM